MSVCIKCLNKIEKGDKVSKLTTIGLDSFKECCKKWTEIGLHFKLFERIDGVIFEEGMVCHKNCFGSITNTSLIQKAVQQYNQRNRVSSEEQCDGVSKISTKYDNEKTEVELIASSNEAKEPNEIVQLYKSEVLDMVKDIVLKQKKTIDMNQIQDHLKLILKRDGLDNSYNYKRYLKDLVQNDTEISTAIEFFNSRKKATVVASKSLVEDIISRTYYEGYSTEIDSTVILCKEIRQELTEALDFRWQIYQCRTSSTSRKSC